MTRPGPESPHLDRRAFVIALGGAAAGLVLADPLSGRAPARPPRLAPVGLQLYTVRSLMEQDVAGTLRRVGEVGFDEVEFAGYFDHAPDRLRGILDAAGLTAPSAHVSLDALEGDNARATLDAARTLGHQWLVIAWVPPEQRGTLDDWRRIAARLQAAGEKVADAGLRLAYHNHDFEFEPIDGTVPYRIVTDTDPERVALQLDLYWVRKAGSDALTWFRRYPGRFPSVHVKDMAADGSITDVGSGVIDWEDLLSQARAAGVEHFFVEHDQPDDPVASIRRSCRYLRDLPA